ncbi:hypothetical protein [Kitasatospora sp. NPDC050543]|uniref:hypothetical protein n=1 Tax=Kitasatospora sp. NPDC050543 TaxID=3364054 RepID=UPI003789F40E
MHPYHQPRAVHPGDAQPADPEQMALPGIRSRAAWQIVLIRAEGRWQPGLLTEWCRLPTGHWTLGSVRPLAPGRQPAARLGLGAVRLLPLTAEGVLAAEASERHIG